MSFFQNIKLNEFSINYLMSKDILLWFGLFLNKFLQLIWRDWLLKVIAISVFDSDSSFNIYLERLANDITWFCELLDLRSLY